MDGQNYCTLANRDNGLEGRMTPERIRGMRYGKSKIHILLCCYEK